MTRHPHGAGSPALPLALPGFEHVARAWDPRRRRVWAKIGPGEYYATLRDETIETVLGSCVAACVRDRVFGLGGMNHFMLPLGDDARASGSGWGLDDGARYGNYAMELLINALLSHGARRTNLEVKLFGGGRVLNIATDVGQRNIAFVRDYLAAEGLPTVAEDLGGPWPRKVRFDPSTGKAQVKRLRPVTAQETLEREQRLVAPAPSVIAGSIELF